MHKKKIKDMLSDEGIDLSGIITINECTVTRRYLLERAGIENGSVIVMAVPYVSDDFGRGNVSEYAKSRDYHLYFRDLFERLIPRLKSSFPDNTFCGFADHSPIDEREAAARAGLGMIGMNGLLITEKYSSFVFLGEIITDLILESDAKEIAYCEKCGRCLTACPASLSNPQNCLSALTQKKGELTDSECALIVASDRIWGCDCCQTACPHTESALAKGTIFSSIPFFTEQRLPVLTYNLISEMSEAEFSQRAYAWRGRKTILRNLCLWEAGVKRGTCCDEKHQAIYQPNTTKKSSRS